MGPTPEKWGLGHDAEAAGATDEGGQHVGQLHLSQGVRLAIGRGPRRARGGGTGRLVGCWPEMGVAVKVGCMAGGDAPTPPPGPHPRHTN